MSDISTADIIRIANGFLLDSPPGEFMEIVTGMKVGFRVFSLWEGSMKVGSM